MVATPNVDSITDADYTIVRLLDAPRDMVFAAWTQPGHVTKWLAPRGITTPITTMSMDLRPGGVWRASMVSGDGTVYPLKGLYLEVVPPTGWSSPPATRPTQTVHRDPS